MDIERNPFSHDELSRTMLGEKRDRWFSTPLGPAEIRVKAILVGESGAGKSQIARRLQNCVFDATTESTIEKNISTIGVKVENGTKTVLVDLWDTGGQEKYRSVVPQFYRDSIACIFVYSIAQRDTFEELEWWIKEYIKEKDMPKYPAHVAGPDGGLNAAIVGTHSDLSHFREVAEVELENLASKYEIPHFTELSSVNAFGANMTDLMLKILAESAYEYMVYEDEKQGGADEESIELSSDKEKKEQKVKTLRRAIRPKGENMNKNGLNVANNPREKSEQQDNNCCA